MKRLKKYLGIRAVRLGIMAVFVATFIGGPALGEHTGNSTLKSLDPTDFVVSVILSQEASVDTHLDEGNGDPTGDHDDDGDYDEGDYDEGNSWCNEWETGDGESCWECYENDALVDSGCYENGNDDDDSHGSVDDQWVCAEEEVEGGVCGYCEDQSTGQRDDWCYYYDDEYDFEGDYEFDEYDEYNDYDSDEHAYEFEDDYYEGTVGGEIDSQKDEMLRMLGKHISGSEWQRLAERQEYLLDEVQRKIENAEREIEWANEDGVDPSAMEDLKEEMEDMLARVESQISEVQAIEKIVVTEALAIEADVETLD
ncbi:MAG: hypothetical protein Q8P27_02200, partial [Candidatus Peregrinibacteria bacterium]|nr:hypothetical protein [Candidatus Peregrinibacteria bacterium]